MHSQQIVLSALLLVGIVIGSSIFLYALSQNFISLTKPRPRKISAPPLVLHSEINGIDLTLLVQNPTDENVQYSGLVYVRDASGRVVATAELNVELGPGETKMITSRLDRLPSSASTITVESSTYSIARTNLTDIPLRFSISNGLTFSPPDEDRYSNVLFHGDYNTVKIYVEGPPGTYKIYGDCISPVDCEPFVPCTTYTTSVSPSCEINAEAGKFFEFNLTATNPTSSDASIGYRWWDSKPYLFDYLRIDNDPFSGNEYGFPLCDEYQVPVTVPAHSSVTFTVRCLAPLQKGV